MEIGINTPVLSLGCQKGRKKNVDEHAEREITSINEHLNE
jgi:hypothetical protein